MNKALLTVPIERIEGAILVIRGEKVILDSDLALLYGVRTKRLNEQVKRNQNRFPVDFMFQLTEAEKSEVVANCDHLGKLRFSPALPFARRGSPAGVVAPRVFDPNKTIRRPSTGRRS